MHLPQHLWYQSVWAIVDKNIEPRSLSLHSLRTLRCNHAIPPKYTLSWEGCCRQAAFCRGVALRVAYSSKSIPVAVGLATTEITVDFLVCIGFPLFLLVQLKGHSRPGIAHFATGQSVVTRSVFWVWRGSEIALYCPTCLLSRNCALCVLRDLIKNWLGLD